MPRHQKYEALTNARCADDVMPCFNFRAGETLELPLNEAEILLKAEAIKPLDGPAPAAVAGSAPAGSGRQGGGNQPSNQTGKR